LLGVRAILKGDFVKVKSAPAGKLPGHLSYSISNYKLKRKIKSLNDCLFIAESIGNLRE